MGEVKKAGLDDADLLRTDGKVWDFKAAVAVGERTCGRISLNAHERARQAFSGGRVAHHAVERSERVVEGLRLCLLLCAESGRGEHGREQDGRAVEGRGECMLSHRMHGAFFNGGWGLFPGPQMRGTGGTRGLDPLTVGSSVHAPL